MIAPARKHPRKSPLPAWHSSFLGMLPAIRNQAEYAFRRMRPEAKEEAIAEVVCAACSTYARLVSQGKTDRANASALAQFAVKQYRAGRRLGCPLNIKDVSSRYCQLRKNVVIEQLDRQSRKTGEWEEILLEDRHAGPADTAAARIDVREWFRRMRPGDRRIARALALGNGTVEVAERFGISPARVSQKRSEFRQTWEEFQGQRDGQRDAVGHRG
jgi:hypothetical protein